jgi:exopolysaccharide biosynthesis polyprenyl glycosylphosphotransferase
MTDLRSDPELEARVDKTLTSPGPARPDVAPTAPKARTGPSRQAGRASLRWLRLADLLALAGAVAAAGRFGPAVAAYALAVAAIGMQQRVRICLRVSDQVGRVLVACGLPVPFLLPWLASGLAWRLALFSAAAIVVTRSLAYATLRSLHRHGRLTEVTLIVGAGDMGALITNRIMEHPEFGLRPVGLLDGCPPLNEPPLPILGSTADLVSAIDRYRARRVIVSFPVEPDRDIVPALNACRAQGVDVCVVSRLQELGSTIPRGELDEIWGIALIPLRGRVQPPLSKLAKRLFDVVAASILLCVLSPVLVVLAVLVRLRMGKPALFRQLRDIGEGRTASILKLRTLPEHDDSDTTWSVPMAGCTGLGRWLRSTHIDELTQLVNVIRGDMSLVGPRPERPHFVQKFNTEIPLYEDRTRMRAGITGWAQVHGLHGDTSIRERVRFDNQYIESWSLWLDVVILARTLVAAVAPRRARK